MTIDKDQILQLLRSRGQDDKAAQADKELPGQVDTEDQGHKNILDSLGIDLKDVLGALGGGGGGGLGGVAGKLGL